VYTIAGVAIVVTGAGAVYYIRSSPSSVSIPFSNRRCLALGSTRLTSVPPRNRRTQHPSSAKKRGGNGNKPREKEMLRRLPHRQAQPSPPLRLPRLPLSKLPTSYLRLTKQQSNVCPRFNGKSMLPS
jgi:hypothetical protein